jgi:hypothetical protein
VHLPLRRTRAVHAAKDAAFAHCQAAAAVACTGTWLLHLLLLRHRRGHGHCVGCVSVGITTVARAAAVCNDSSVSAVAVVVVLVVGIRAACIARRRPNGAQQLAGAATTTAATTATTCAATAAADAAVVHAALEPARQRSLVVLGPVVVVCAQLVSGSVALSAPVRTHGRRPLEGHPECAEHLWVNCFMAAVPRADDGLHARAQGGVEL